MRRKIPFAAATASAMTLAAVGATAPAYGEGAQLPSPNASCMGFLADASNPNASGDHIAAAGQSGVASTIAQSRPSGSDPLLSCVAQIP
jgi:hypothetical protein